MNLVSLQLHEFMRVECVEMTFPQAGTFTIGAKNGSGKTSILEFLKCAFGGKVPAVPVKIGSKKSLGKLTLDDEGHTVTVEIEVLPDRELRATIRQDGGMPFSSPVVMLKSWVNSFSFDPFALMNLRGREQRDTFLECLGVTFDDLEAQAKDIKDERKLIGRDVTGRERQINLMPQHSDAPAEEVNIFDLSAELNKAMTWNQKCLEAASVADDWAQEVHDLTYKIEDARKTLHDLEEKLAAGIDSKKQAKAYAEKMKPIDIVKIQKAISNADATNAKVRANKARAALVAQFDADRAKTAALGEKLKEIDLAKQDRLKTAKAPVEGLTFTDEAVLFDGLPLSQDSGSGQMIRCVELAAALNPKLKCICVDDAERLLEGRMAELDAWATANGYLILAFRATEGKECMFTLEEGCKAEEAPHADH